jgi:ribose transport system substrate-binding protein
MMMKRRTLLLEACVLAVVAGVTGCKPSNNTADQPGSSGGSDAVIGVSVLTFSNPFFIELSDAIKEEAAKHNYRVIVADGDMDPVTQDHQVDDFITKQVTAIVLCPCDSRSVGASIKKANEANIPVFTADIASLSDQGQVVCHVATDNYGGGEAAAEAVIEMLDGEGKVAILNHPRIESAIMREEGFNEAIKEAPKIEVVATLPGGGEKKMSLDAAKDLIQTHPGLDGLFCINDPSALGAAEALKTEVASGQIQIVGFDAQKPARIAVKDGQLYATIVQYPKKIGSTVADAVHQYLVGKEIQKEILIPVSIYRKADADEDPTLKQAASGQ